MGRYYAAQGIRHIQPTVVGGPFIERFPFLVIFGPSGNAVQVHGPSGFSGRKPEDSHELHAYEDTFNHAALAWYKNEILTCYREDNQTIDQVWGYAWQPYGQPSGDGAFINTATFIPETSADFTDDVVRDGFNWKMALERPGGNHTEKYAFKRVGGSIHWVFSYGDGEQIAQGLYKGKNSVFITKGTGSGHHPQGGILGSMNNANAEVFRAGLLGRAGGLDQQAGIEYERSLAGNSNNFCDMIYHKGTMYIAKQYAIVGITLGGKGNFIIHDADADDTLLSTASQTSDTLDYTSRKTSNNFGGSLSRSFAEHRGRLYMLSNDGKIHEVNPGGLEQVADLTTLGTPWSSGVVGGALLETPSASTWPGVVDEFRCKLFSFNDQLHAFLNFKTSFRIAKASDSSNFGKGILWATSFDAANWTDFSQGLPASGIIPSSGQPIGQWLAETNPYILSGRTGGDALPYPSGLINGSIGGPLVAGESNFPAQPSGFRQNGVLPFWSSGNLVDPEGTAFNQLQIPLEYGSISGYLFPTWVQYPQGFGFQNNIFGPSGVGPSGYDYTGCKNYHISAEVDPINKKVNIIFTEDFDEGGTLYFELNESSGFIQKNYLPQSKQLNSLVSIDLYDPEIIIPSGDLLNPNPRIDFVNNNVHLKYNIHDWGFWSNVDVISEYSTDGQTWNFIGKSRNKNTGSLETDPSGVLGTEHELIWQYTKGPNPLNKNAFYGNVQMRLRAEVT